MPKYVCDGAKLKCPFGSDDGSLVVIHPIKPVQLEGNNMGNIGDSKPLMNIQPFGQCKSLANPTVAAATAANYGKLQEMPCIPNTPGLWLVGKFNVLVKGQPALLDCDTLMCMWGGMIQVSDPGQSSNETEASGCGCDSDDKKGCFFESINIFFEPNDDEKKDESITLYEKDTSRVKIKELYFISNAQGKPIKVEAKREKEDGDCKKEDLHSKIILRDSEDECEDFDNTGSNEITIKYYDITLDMLLNTLATKADETMYNIESKITGYLPTNAEANETHWINYITLPDFHKGDPRYDEANLKFISCKKKEDVKILVYPDIKYTIKLVIKKDQYDTAEKKGKLERPLTFSVEYGSKKSDIIEIDTLDVRDKKLETINAIKDLAKTFAKFKENFCKLMDARPGKGAKIKTDYVEAEISPPSLEFSFEWKYDVSDNYDELGALLTGSIKFEPLIKAEITIRVLDLLLKGGAKLAAAAGATGVGALISVLLELALFAKRKARAIAEELGGKCDIYIDLKFGVELKIGIEGKYSTIKSKKTEFSGKYTPEYYAMIKAGAEVKGKIVVVEVDAEASASAKVTFQVEAEIKIADKSEVKVGGKLLPFEVKLVAKAMVGFFIFKGGPNVEITYKYPKDKDNIKKIDIYPRKT